MPIVARVPHLLVDDVGGVPTGAGDQVVALFKAIGIGCRSWMAGFANPANSEAVASMFPAAGPMAAYASSAPKSNEVPMWFSVVAVTSGLIFHTIPSSRQSNKFSVYSSVRKWVSSEHKALPNW